MGIMRTKKQGVLKNNIFEEDKVELNEGYYHEAMDRCHVLMDTINNHLIEHPVGKQNKEINRMFVRALVSLMEAYQMAGDEIIKLNKNDRPKKHKLRK